MRLFFVILALLCPLPLYAQQSSSPVSLAEHARFGDWEVRCEVPPGASQQHCALIQSVIAENKGNAPLVMAVFKAPDGKTILLRVIVPLGIFITAGLGLKIDDTEIGRTNFVRCLPSGCMAEVYVDEKLLSQLSKGTQATFIIFENPEEGYGIPLSLKGFPEGFAKLP